jgi:hypothetical protein
MVMFHNSRWASGASSKPRFTYQAMDPAYEQSGQSLDIFIGHTASVKIDQNFGNFDVFFNAHAYLFEIKSL